MMLEFIVANVLVQGFVLISDQFNKHLLQISHEPGIVLIPEDAQRGKAQFWKSFILLHLLVTHYLCYPFFPFYPILYERTHVTSCWNLERLLRLSCGFWLTFSSRVICWSMVYNKWQWCILIMYTLIHSFHKYLLCVFYCILNIVLGILRQWP